MPLEAKNLRSPTELAARGDLPRDLAGHAPEAAPRQASKPKLERLIGTTLLVGVLASTLLVLVGGVVYVSERPHAAANYRVFHGDQSDLRHLQGVWAKTKSFSGPGIIQFGLMMLVSLQVVRVILTGVLFTANRDWVFVTITTIVLALLAYGLLYEGVGGH